MSDPRVNTSDLSQPLFTEAGQAAIRNHDEKEAAKGRPACREVPTDNSKQSRNKS